MLWIVYWCLRQYIMNAANSVTTFWNSIEDCQTAGLSSVTDILRLKLFPFLTKNKTSKSKDPKETHKRLSPTFKSYAKRMSIDVQDLAWRRKERKSEEPFYEVINIWKEKHVIYFQLMADVKGRRREIRFIFMWNHQVNWHYFAFRMGSSLRFGEIFYRYFTFLSFRNSFSMSPFLLRDILTC